LLTVPALLLLYQSVRLGTAARERRLAALRLAGATPREIRYLGAVEVGVPVTVGSVLGLGFYALLRATLGGDRTGEVGTAMYELRLVPTTVAPTWWQVCLVVVGVAASGVAVGLRASRRLTVTPLGVTRRRVPPPPRPWGLIPLGAVVLLLAGGAVGLPLSRLPFRDSRTFYVVAGIVVVGLAMLGIVSQASWVAYRVGRFVAARTASATILLAACRLVAEPRPAGRAAAAVGGIGLVAGGASAAGADLVSNGTVEPFYVVSLLIVGLALLAALLVVTGTLAVHSVESLLDRKRSIAALTALGTEDADLERAQRWEAGLVALPMVLVGTVLGNVLLSGFVVSSWVDLALATVTIAVMVALTCSAIAIGVRATRPWVRRAGDPANLRTE
jgi:hypothetical protein